MGTNGYLAHKIKIIHLLKYHFVAETLQILIFQQTKGGHYNVHTNKPRIYSCLFWKTDSVSKFYTYNSVQSIEATKDEAIYPMYGLTITRFILKISWVFFLLVRFWFIANKPKPHLVVVLNVFPRRLCVSHVYNHLTQ